MILTNCAACAAPLAHGAPGCARCLTRYCSRTCQMDHIRRGHEQICEQICEEIHRGGNAEQYHAEKKYKEAVAVAVEACAADTKGQTCYICYGEGDEEGLVRGCACRGENGFAHVSCLARMARVAVENDVDSDGARWHSCGMCEQQYHGVVYCALGWACWKTYLGRPEADDARGMAMSVLGNGLSSASHYADALNVQETELAMMRRFDASEHNMRRFGPSEHNMLVVQSNLANTYEALGRRDEGLRLRQDVYSGTLKLLGEEHEATLIEANNYAADLTDLQRFEEAKTLLRKMLPVARRVVGEIHDSTLKTRWIYAMSLYKDADATLADLREAVTTLEDTVRIARRVFGSAHPTTSGINLSLRNARAALRAREAPPPPSPAPLCDEDELD